MKSYRPQVVLITLWLVSFVSCLLIPILKRHSIPENFGLLTKQAFDTFAPGLAMMVAFLFASPATGARAANVPKTVVDWFAIVFALVYLGMFNLFMVNFYLGHDRADQTVKLFQDFRPYLSFLVTGMLAYYFGKTQQTA